MPTMFEVQSECHVFHLDATLPKRFSKDEFVSRYIDIDLAAILEFIKETNPVRARLFIQSPYTEDKEYTIHEIESVTSSTDSAGNPILVCDGSGQQISIPISANKGKFGTSKIIWSRNPNQTLLSRLF